MQANGLEALQYPPGEEISKVGRFKDHDGQEFFTAVADTHTSTIIVSSRIGLVFSDRETANRVPQLPVDRLTNPEAIALIRSWGVEGADSELIPYVTGCRGHALTLMLIAHFIRRAFKNTLPTLEEIRLNAPSGLPDATLAERVLAGYLAWLPPPQQALLVICGLFDQPVESDLIYQLATSLAHERTFRFDRIQTHKWFQFHLETLKSTGLAYDDEVFGTLVDLHPIIKNYLGNLLQEKHETLWRSANKAMYGLLSDRQDDIWALRRIVFGCRGGLAQRAFAEIYEPRFSKVGSTLSTGTKASYSQILYALNAFFQRGSTSDLVTGLTRIAKRTILLDAITYITTLRGYADQHLPRLFASARRELDDAEDYESWRVSYAECRFQRMAGNLTTSRLIFEQLLGIGRRTGNKSLLIGALRNASAYYFYVGEFSRAKELAIEGEHVGYRGPWRTDPLGFVNNPLIMLPGYRALASAMLGEDGEVGLAISRMLTAVEQSADIHSRAIAAFIEAILADLGHGSESLSETAARFERLAGEGELSQWLVAANILRAAASNAGPVEFERLIRRWVDTGARLFLPYWYVLAAEAAERSGDRGSAHNFSARGMAAARSTGEKWLNARLERISVLPLG